MLLLRAPLSVPISDHIELLGVKISSKLNFGKSIESKAKVAAKKLGILNKVRRYFTPGQRLALYQAQVRTSMEYCSLWGGSAKYQLEALDSVDRRARRIIGDNSLTQAKLHSLQHRRNVACLSVFYRIYFGEYAQELHNLVPPSPFYHRTARHRERWHPYVVDIPSTRTKRFFIHVSDTCR
ncbi:jg26030 [Pararge aegeria aegeria]|uniref:Jg26030 protein n=1 Tax=Pararge aegeria aegeria TaxID=348720 RepID=A0A8S4QR78_9NEOP|nr:jg26030 [Pararge aegeria aegeria]